VFDSWGAATLLWQAVVIQTFLGILPFEIAVWAVALVVVHQVLAAAWLASAFWTIWNILAVFDSTISGVRSESTVTLAREIVRVVSGCNLVIFAVSIWAARVLWGQTVIVVDARRWIQNRPVSLASGCNADQGAAQ